MALTMGQNTLVIFVIATLCVGAVSSVILPIRLTPTQPDELTRASADVALRELESEDTEPPVMLTINEGESLEVGVNSASALTVNLNRPISTDIVVSVTVFSGPNLILFDDSTQNTTRSTTVNYEKNTFGDRIIKFNTTLDPGHAEVVCKVEQKKNGSKIDDSSAYISINIHRSPAVSVLISIVGWVYFLAWSLSFYFQVVLNYQRKSVIGLNFDFLALNLLGFICYSIYNFTLKFSREVQQDYYEEHHYSRIPVEYNDLFFAVHAVLLTSITIGQCFMYERGQQSVSVPSIAFIGITSLVGLGLYITHLFNGLPILDVILYLSYVKLAITVIKYTPQAYMNYQRKATTGWSIHNILLDFTGGLFSIGQMFLLGFNYNDWVAIFGNFTKFGLGIISITFDIIFVVQHYVLYKGSSGHLEDSNDSIPSPVINESIRSTTYVPHNGDLEANDRANATDIDDNEANDNPMNEQ